MKPCWIWQLPISADNQLRTVINDINIASPAIALDSTVKRQALIIDTNADVVKYAKIHTGKQVDQFAGNILNTGTEPVSP
jgi:hypothetical protein